MILGLLVGPVLAQQAVNRNRPAAAPARPGEAVDQAVGDLGPRITSFRQVEPGLGAFSSRGQLYRRRSPVDWQGKPRTGEQGGVGKNSPLHLPQSYVYEAPGVRAYVDRPRYITEQGRNRPPRGAVGNRENRYRQVVTPNTVYDLIPEDHPASPLEKTSEREPAQPGLNGVGEQYRVGGRFTTRTDRQVKRRTTGRVKGERRPGPTAKPSARGQANFGPNHPINRTGQGDRAETSRPPASQPVEGDRSRFGPNHPINQPDQTTSKPTPPADQSDGR